MHEFTINIDFVFWIAGGIVALAGAIAAIKKIVAPYFEPIKKMEADVRELKENKGSCDIKFENDKKLLLEMREDQKMIMRSQMLVLKHVETGNCTGEVAAGRKELEDYLINKE